MNKLQCIFKTHLPEVSGTSQKGKDWIKQDIIVSTVDQYPKTVCFTCWGDTTDLVKKLKEGETITVKFDVSSREYNGKWYTELKAEGIEKSQQAEVKAEYQAPSSVGSIDDSLPF